MNLEGLYDDIPIGKENAITKQELCCKWGINDERTVRAIIAELRQQDNNDNYIIMSSSHSKGFYKTNDKDEVMQFKKETVKRAINIFKTLKKVNRILGVNENQINFFEDNAS